MLVFTKFASPGKRAVSKQCPISDLLSKLPSLFLNYSLQKMIVIIHVNDHKPIAFFGLNANFHETICVISSIKNLSWKLENIFDVLHHIDCPNNFPDNSPKR